MDQNTFVRGLIIFDAVDTITDVIDFKNLKGYNEILIAIDFEKAIDSLNWNFLFQSLATFSFGESFIAWIKTFYKNISSCIHDQQWFPHPIF